AEEGLAYQGYIDIFDGGITLEAPPSQVRSIHDSQRLVLAIGTPGDEAQTYLVQNRERQHCSIPAAAGRIAAGARHSFGAGRWTSGGRMRYEVSITFTLLALFA